MLVNNQIYLTRAQGPYGRPGSIPGPGVEKTDIHKEFIKTNQTLVLFLLQTNLPLFSF